MTTSEIWVQYHSWAIGLLVVAVTSYGRFNTPPTSRSSTTWGRYHALAFIYTLALIGTWVVLANAPGILEALAAGNPVPEAIQSLDAPLYAALLLTILVGVPPLNTFDDRVRRFLQYLARIPWEAQRLSAALRARTWLPDEKFSGGIRKTLRDAGFGDADMSFSNDRTPQTLWTRITALREYVNGWETRRGKFSAFYFTNITAIEQLRGDYETLQTNARRVLPMLGTRHPGGDTGVGSIQQELAAGFLAAAERLEKELCDLVSRGVLTCGRTERARRAEFETIGFMVNVAPTHLFDNLLGLYLGLAAIYVSLMTYLGRPKPFIAGIVIATIYTGAVVIALLLKRATWAAELPIARYASTAAAAFAFSALSSMCLGILTTFDVPQSWGMWISRWWPWGLMSAMVAGLVAHFIDQEERPGLNRREAALMALACALMAIPVVALLARACGTTPDCAPWLPRVMLISGLTGAFVGYFVPTWYRRPEVMLSTYERRRILVTVRTNPDGVAAIIEVVPPKPSAAFPPRPVRLPDEIQATSADDATAEAIRVARAWIDAERGLASGDSALGLRLTPNAVPPTSAIGPERMAS